MFVTTVILSFAQ